MDGAASNKVNARKKQINMKDKLYEDSLDLSLCLLVTVPVKEISEIAKVRKLNLSFNSLVSLPEDFSVKLAHIRELDLSKNWLKSLPHNFGQMVNLKSLDLLGNQLVDLPTSFMNLRSLQWLDLKDNPLNNELKRAAGDCFDEVQCKKCAVNVLQHTKLVAAEEERRRQLMLKKQREAKQKQEAEERERENEQRLLRKKEREERRLLSEQKRQERKLANDDEDNDNEDADLRSNGLSSSNRNNLSGSQSASGKAGCLRSMCSLLFSIILLLSLAASLVLVSSRYCSSRAALVKVYPILSGEYVRPVMQLVDKHICPYAPRNTPQLLQRVLKQMNLI